MRSPERNEKAAHPYRAAFGEGASLNTLFLFPASSKSLLLPFLQKRKAAFGEGVAVFALFLIPAPLKVFCLLFFRKVRRLLGKESL